MFWDFFFKFIPHDLLFHSVVTTFLIAVYNRGNLTSQLICCFLFDVLNLLSLNCDSLQTSVLTSVGKFHNCYSGILHFTYGFLTKRAYNSHALLKQFTSSVLSHEKNKKGVHDQNVFCGIVSVGEPRPSRS